MGIKQSVCIPMLKPADLSLEEMVAACAEIGYAAVEIWGRDDQFAELIALAAKYNVVVASMIGHGALGDGLNNPDNHDRIEAELRASIDIAADSGVPGLICFSGNRRPGQSDADGIAVTAAGLRRVAAYAEAKQINLNVELLNSKVDHAGYQCDHTAWGVAMCEQVGSPNVKLLYDIYHMQIMEGDIIRTIEAQHQWIAHYHTAGNPGRRDFDADQELNYGAICRAIAATGYELYVGHEFKPKGDAIEALRQAFAICDV